MGILLVVVGSAVLLIAAYFSYGRLLSRLLNLDDSRPTPAVTQRDGVDYEPIPPRFLIGQHFSAIAAAGPIVGPILAGVMFGWLPALIWILIGSILIGGVHDLATLTASIRHKARSIAEVVREYISPRAYVLFLLFVYLALIYIVVAFTDIVAGSFVGRQTLENGAVVTGAGIASSSLMYLVLPVAMGLLMRFARMPLWLATVIFVPLMGLAIWLGQSLPIDLAAWLSLENASAAKVWGGLLLFYCVLASVAPVWLLLQPRGHLGGIYLYLALAGGAIGLIIGSLTGDVGLSYPAFRGWNLPDGSTLAPILFITIACGACSGFHALIASGTTSKQLRRETDARIVGYGTMLMEAMVAVVSLACVMMLAADDPHLKSSGSVVPANMIYANGIGRFLAVFGIPPELAVTFGLLAFTTFVYDTLDVCTRLGRYILQELTGWNGSAGRWIGTLITAAIPLAFLLTPTPVDAAGQAVPAWKLFWSLFGASNQLLAALALLAATVWLWRSPGRSTRPAARRWWVIPVLGVPTVFMTCMSLWALSSYVRTGLFPASSGGVFVWTTNPVPWTAIVLMALALMVLIESALAITRPWAGMRSAPA